MCYRKIRWIKYIVKYTVNQSPITHIVVGVSFTLEVEFEFTTWAWVQATAETAFGSGLVVRSPGSVKALNQSTHNSLSHCRNVHSAVAGHGRMNFRQWPATAKWTFRQWLRELWVDWFNALIEPGDRTTRPPQECRFGGGLNSSSGWWTQTLPRLYRIHCCWLFYFLYLHLLSIFNMCGSHRFALN